MPKLVNYVEVFEAKPNKMFTEENRQAVRFLRYLNSIPCAECGKRRKHHWTLLAAFKAQSMGMLVPTGGKVVHNPLTPVCRDHLLAWALTEEDEKCGSKMSEAPIQTERNGLLIPGPKLIGAVNVIDGAFNEETF